MSALKVSAIAIVMAIALMTEVSAINTVPSLNVTQYLGRWFQVYEDPFDAHTFQPKSNCATATYGLDTTRGAGYVSVRNWNRLDNTSGTPKEIFGYAWQPHPNSEPGQLRVVLHGGAPFPAPYWVVKLGPVVNDEYDYAVVTDDLKLTLFILARDVTTFFALYATEVVAWCKAQGFDSFIDKPEVLPQAGCTYVWGN